MASGARLVGNRLALVGTLVYFLEWLAIAFIPETGDPALLGEDPAVVVDVYRGEAGASGFAAGWFGLVLLGRILFVAACGDRCATPAATRSSWTSRSAR